MKIYCEVSPIAGAIGLLIVALMTPRSNKIGKRTSMPTLGMERNPFMFTRGTSFATSTNMTWTSGG